RMSMNSSVDKQSEAFGRESVILDRGRDSNVIGRTFKVISIDAEQMATSQWRKAVKAVDNLGKGAGNAARLSQAALLQVSAMVARIALQAPRIPNSSNAALCVAAGILPADLELGTIAATRLAGLGCARALDQSLSV
ncbi:hypothetical protein FOZ60_014248, partial [Perkinsus olseni]